VPVHTFQPLLAMAGIVLSGGLQAQTLGQFRIVDFSARQPIVAASVTSGTEIRTTSAHGLSSGAAVYIYPPLTVAQDSTVPGFRTHGNRGRGYFIITVTDDTRFVLTSEMYTGVAFDRSKYTIAAGDVIIPLTTYQVKPGPRVWLDGPINKGAWSASATYRTHEMVSDGGKSYMAIANNTNQEPPNSNYWIEIDPSRVGPGTFTASLRDTSGKASNGNLAFSQLKASLAKYWAQPSRTYDYSYEVYPTGFGGTMSAERWFADGEAASYTAAKRLATQAEDLPDGTVGCDPAGAFCGRLPGNIDFSRLAAWRYIPAMAMIYDTLAPAEKGALLDRLFNDNDVAHNGIETNGGNNCDIATYNPGPGSISVSNFVVTGSGFSSLDGLKPGAIMIYTQTGYKNALGRVKSVDSDTQITLEQAAYAAASGKMSAANWWYVKPFGYGGAHTCGLLWILKHHPSSPRMIPGQEAAYGLKDYTTITTPDDSPRQNKTISALVPFIAAALLGAYDDMRAVRLGEQAINYYMTQTMAQEQKSRGTGLDGHGTQYGTGRTASGEMMLGWILKNSLTVTPPGILTGTYLTSIMQAYQYVFWLGNPLVVQPWATGYGININASNNLYLSYIGTPMMVGANLFPNDPFAGHTWDYLRHRRGDYGDLSEASGWGSIAFQMMAFPFYDPLATATPVTTEPLQRALWKTDEQECIDSGLYCRPDTGEYMAMSQTGWGKTDTQVMIQAQAALPTQDDDNYGTAGNVTILQNNGSKSTYLLGGNGLGLSGYGSGQSPSSGMEQGNTISLFNPSSSNDMWAKAVSGLQYARLTRWAGDPVTGVPDSSYVYTLIDLTPTVRDSAHRYDPANATRMCFYLPAACSGPGGARARVNRHVIHFKNPADPNYVVMYDDIQAGPENLQPRAYFHYQASSLQGSDRARHPEWITTFDTEAKKVVLTVPGSARLSSVFLPVLDVVNTRLDQGRATTRHASRIALVTDQPDGSFKNVSGLPAATSTGTFRVIVCASHNGDRCGTARSAEWISVHMPSVDLNASMPPADQPACNGIGGACAAVQIRDDRFGKVAVFARQGALLNGVALTTSHAGQAQYVIAGLAPGTYAVAMGATVIANGAVVAPNDNTLSFTSSSGNIQVVPTGRMVTNIAITQSTTIVAGGQQQLSAVCTYSDSTTSDCTTIVEWTSSTPDVATVSASGLVTAVATGTTTIMSSYIGATASTVITVP
jgi:hypothetical protein